MRIYPSIIIFPKLYPLINGNYRYLFIVLPGSKYLRMIF